MDTGHTRNHVLSDSFLAFLISDIQEWINTLNIQELDGPLEDFRRGLRI